MVSKKRRRLNADSGSVESVSFRDRTRKTRRIPLQQDADGIQKVEGRLLTASDVYDLFPFLCKVLRRRVKYSCHCPVSMSSCDFLFFLYSFFGVS